MEYLLTTKSSPALVQGKLILLGFAPLLSLKRAPGPGDNAPVGTFLTVTIAEQDYLIPQKTIDRARRLGGDALYQAGLRVLAEHARDISQFEQSGLDLQWRANFSTSLESMHQHHDARSSAAAGSRVGGALFLDEDDHAVAAARILLTKGRAAGLSSLSKIKLSRMRSYDGRLQTLQTLSAAVKVPATRAALLAVGVKPDLLDQMAARAGQLFSGGSRRSADRIGRQGESLVFTAEKAALYQDIQRISILSRSDVASDRQKEYRLNRLFARRRGW